MTASLQFQCWPRDKPTSALLTPRQLAQRINLAGWLHSGLQGKISGLQTHLSATRLSPCEPRVWLGLLCTFAYAQSTSPQRHYCLLLQGELSSPPNTSLSLAWNGRFKRFGLYLYFCLLLWGRDRDDAKEAVAPFHQQGAAHRSSC